MSPRPTSSRAVPSLITGAATAAYYASPDFISSRTVRGWVKAGLVAVSVAASVPELRASGRSDGEAGQGAGALAQALRSMPARGKAAAAGVVAVALAGTAAGAVAGERWMFRRGQRRAAAGKRFAHTGPALLYGALTAAAGLIPSPEERRA
jgi:hypothetical protein